MEKGQQVPLSSLSSLQLASYPDNKSGTTSTTSIAEESLQFKKQPLRWKTHISNLPGGIKPIVVPRKGAFSHQGIGLGAGILGGSPLIDPTPSSTTKKIKQAKKYSKFLNETDSIWTEEHSDDSDSDSDTENSSTNQQQPSIILQYNKLIKESTSFPAAPTEYTTDKTLDTTVSSSSQDMESSNLQRTDSRGVLNWKKGSKDADSGTPTSLGGNLGLRQSVTRRSTDGGFGGASRKSNDIGQPSVQSNRMSGSPGTSPGSDSEGKMVAELARLNSMSIRYTKFRNVLEMPNVDLDQLRKLSWSGIPEEIRPTVWKVLMGYLPCNSDRRDATITRKRKEYEEYVSQSFSRGKAGLDQALYHQIHIDIQRTNSSIPLYQNTTAQECLERVLYCWAIRHPASGYVQGINDLVTPFFQVFLYEQIPDLDSNNVILNVEDEAIKEKLGFVEADSYWCLTKLLDGIQDNYTFSQPGIQRQVTRLKALISRIDAPLHNHLQTQGVEFIQFAFRWMNCLLMREVTLKNTVRMWDTYMSEGTDGFSDFHLYVCAAFLVKWSDKLRKQDFQEIMMFLQSLPTQDWGDKDIELLLSEAFMWKSLFHNSPSHLQQN